MAELRGFIGLGVADTFENHIEIVMRWTRNSLGFSNYRFQIL